MFTIEREYQLAAAHRLPNVPEDHKCGRVHGHNFTVRVVCTGLLDETMGWMFDFAKLDDAWRTLVHEVLDHHDLNEVEGLENPTSENLARWVFDRMFDAVLLMSDSATIKRIEVAETGKGKVIYEP